MYVNFIKPLFDFLISLLALLILLPILLLISMVLILTLRGSPFFFQERPGKNEKLFKLIKFRTMLDGRDSNGYLLHDKYRLTVVGKLLRSTSLDELPQLINVFKGDMSLIGPRPLLIKYLPLYSAEQARRHEVRPGITGWAQVNGRNAIGWDEKFKLDIWYVDNVSLRVDFKIFCLTLKRVLKRTGINFSNSENYNAFTGNK